MSERQPTRQLTEDEWIVLLDVYQSHKDETLTAKHSAIVKASALFNALAELNGRRSGPGFRPPSGLHQQLRIFQRLELPSSSIEPKVPKLAASVWKQFAMDPSARRKAADAVRAKVTR